jgi:DNA-binding CsgD family transcriptional regulator
MESRVLSVAAAMPINPANAEKGSAGRMMAAAAANDRPSHGGRRRFSERARRAAYLQAHGYSRKQIAQILGVAPETVSVWKRHPHWQQELERWRALAEVPLDRTQQRLAFESLHATLEALEQLRLLMGATKRVRTPSGLVEAPDWPTRLKACRLVLAASVATVPELAGPRQG